MALSPIFIETGRPESLKFCPDKTKIGHKKIARDIYHIFIQRI
jgi:hypothetical protein